MVGYIYDHGYHRISRKERNSASLGITIDGAHNIYDPSGQNVKL